MDQHSRYWLDDELFDQDDSLPESPEGADLQRLRHWLPSGGR